MLDSALQKALASASAHCEFSTILDYAVLPPGKLFRPKLVQALARDLGELAPAHCHLASAIELHHAYTLVHDDLPSMDNDLMRRGKSSTHALYGEWKAILAGDALCVASFGELAKIRHRCALELITLMAWATGPKGLILGQFLDLGAKGKAKLADVIRIHELKTARLIQVATLGTYLLSEDKLPLKGKVEFLRLGREIGVTFQLLDDLSELAEGPATIHEKEINPFLFSPVDTLLELQGGLRRLRAITDRHQLTHLNSMLLEYFKKNQSSLQKGHAHLEKNLDNNLAFEKIKNWALQFVWP